jgi:hypothetical protein
MPGGRPTKYNKQLHPIIGRALSKLGNTSQGIADEIGVGLSTVELWKKQHKEFMDAIKKGRADLVTRLEGALYRRAEGYDTKEVEAVQDKEGKIIPQKIKIKHIPADAACLIFSLVNLTRNVKDAMKWEHVTKQELAMLPPPDDPLKEMTAKEKDTYLDKLLKRREDRKKAADGKTKSE